MKIDRTNIKMPYLYGDIERVEIITTICEKVEHTWLVFHGTRTFAGKVPFKVHIGRRVI